MYGDYSQWANTWPQEHYVKSAILDLNLAPLWQPEGLPVRVGSSVGSLRIADLGWTQQQAAEIRASLASFEADWNAPGMEGYDEL